MQTKSDPHAGQGGEGQSALIKTQPKDSTYWRVWLDMPLGGYFTDGGVETLDWVMA